MSADGSLRITSVFPGTFNIPAPDVPRLINTKSAFIERQADPSPRVDFTIFSHVNASAESLSTLLASHGESLANLVAPLLGASAGQGTGAKGGAGDQPRGMINLCKRKGRRALTLSFSICCLHTHRCALTPYMYCYKYTSPRCHPSVARAKVVCMVDPSRALSTPSPRLTRSHPLQRHLTRPLAPLSCLMPDVAPGPLWVSMVKLVSASHSGGYASSIPGRQPGERTCHLQDLLAPLLALQAACKREAKALEARFPRLHRLHRVRLLSPWDFVDVLDRIKSRQRDDFTYWFEQTKYDCPKLVDAILRLRSMGNSAPVLRFDQDVLFNDYTRDDNMALIRDSVNKAVQMYERWEKRRNIRCLVCGVWCVVCAACCVLCGKKAARMCEIRENNTLCGVLVCWCVGMSACCMLCSTAC